jgi:hypothetical protein
MVLKKLEIKKYWKNYSTNNRLVPFFQLQSPQSRAPLFSQNPPVSNDHSVNSHQQHFHLQLSRTFAPAYQAGKPLKRKND